jgi:ribosome biogenesis GTPase / thiamine phosphate phosphatase
MDLTEIGYDDWFRKKPDETGIDGCEAARVSAVDRDRYLVLNETGEIRAEAAGSLLFAAESPGDLPCVGDWVLLRLLDSGTFAVIHRVIPRKTFLRRKTAGRTVDSQMIAANIDTALILQSCDHDFNVRRLERYMVAAGDGGIEPVLLLSKTDLAAADDAERLESKVREAGLDIPIIPFSSATGSGLDAVASLLRKSRTYCLLGSSGVGKTTLLNRLVGRDAFETNAVREKDGKGRHTTARRQMIVLAGGALLIDTPGMRELGLIGAEEGIERTYPDVLATAAECRFSDCTHTNEPDCAVLEAVRSGRLSEDRLTGYRKLSRESEYHRMSYAEKRRKDREFGRMVKSVLKHKKKE